jgi:hypothetical protein
LKPVEDELGSDEADRSLEAWAYQLVQRREGTEGVPDLVSPAAGVVGAERSAGAGGALGRPARTLHFGDKKHGQLVIGSLKTCAYLSLFLFLLV